MLHSTHPKHRRPPDLYPKILTLPDDKHRSNHIIFIMAAPEHPPQDSVLKKSARKLCWDSRDKYFGCLDKAEIIDPRKGDNADKAKKLCSKEDTEFNRDCISSWVSISFARN